MRRPAIDPIEREIKRATDRRRGLKPWHDPGDARKAKARRRIEDLADERRIKEQTTWL